MAITLACRQTLKKELPDNAPVQRGQRFMWSGRKWQLLDVLEDTDGQRCLVAIMVNPAWPKCVAFGGNNNWAASDVRKRLEEDVLPALDKAQLRPITTDMVSDDGDEKYGACEDYIALLTADAYRAYRPWVPKYEDWIWTATPWYTGPHPGYANYVRYVNTSGALNYSNALNAYGLVPGLCAISAGAEIQSVEE